MLGQGWLLAGLCMGLVGGLNRIIRGVERGGELLVLIGGA
jgi:hypothetical protein